MTIEYMISSVAFISLVIYIYLLYSGNIPNFISEVRKEHSRSTAYQLSELLVNDPGEPSNWNSLSDDQIKRIGLSDQTKNLRNLLSLQKIVSLNAKCPSYQGYLNVQKWLGLNETFSIHFYNITDTGNRQSLLSCNPPQALLKKTEINATVKRITAFVDTNGEKNFGELIVEVSG